MKATLSKRGEKKGVHGRFLSTCSVMKGERLHGELLALCRASKSSSYVRQQGSSVNLREMAGESKPIVSDYYIDPFEPKRCPVDKESLYG